MFPPNGAQLELANSPKPNPVPLKVAGGVGALTLLVNGIPITNRGGNRTLSFEPDGPGFVRLTVMDAAGSADSVSIRLQ
jgi:penicillin-binding protein 1C